jgi:hypothetical protein
MSQIARTLWRVVVVAAAVGLTLAFTSTEAATAVHVAGVAALLGAGGALANRLWIGLLPFAAAAAYLAVAALQGRAPGADFTWSMAVTLLAIAAAVVAAGLVAGVLLRRAFEHRGAHTRAVGG